MNDSGYTQYAKEVTKRFDRLMGWAIANCPVDAPALTATDFRSTERELKSLLGAKLHMDEQGSQGNKGSASVQYESVTPMPWP